MKKVARAGATIQEPRKQNNCAWQIACEEASSNITKQPPLASQSSLAAPGCMEPHMQPSKLSYAHEHRSDFEGGNLLMHLGLL